jgi:hypothetical protein
MSAMSHSIPGRQPHGLCQDTVSVHGRLDLAGLAQLRCASGVRQVVLDLSTMISYPAGLARTLSWAHSQLRASGTELLITGAPRELGNELAQAARTLGTLPGWDHHMPSPEVTIRASYRPENSQPALAERPATPDHKPASIGSATA